MGFPRRSFTVTSESVCIRNVFFPSTIALHQNTSPGDSVSSQNSSDFTSQWVDTPTSFPANWKSCFSLVKESFPCLVGGDGKILSCFGVREAEIPQLTQGKGTKRESEEFLLMHEPSWEICSNFCVEKLGCSHTELWGLSDLHTFSFHGFVGIFVPV